MEIDFSDIKYKTVLINEKGAVIPLDSAVSVSWEESEGQLAARADVSCFNIDIYDGAKGSRLTALAKLNSVISINAYAGKYVENVFRGNIWNTRFEHTKSGYILHMTAFDPLIRLNQSADKVYFPAGLDTASVIGTLCGKWNIPLNYDYTGVIHGKIIYNGDKISSVITKLLEEVRQKTGVKYVIRYKNNAVNISENGINDDVFVFDDKTVISGSEERDLHNMVTRVKVYGTADDSSSLEAVANGDLSFGTLQEIVRRAGDKTLGDAVADAQNIIKERGKPEYTYNCNTFDVPFIHKGFKIKSKADVFAYYKNHERFFYVKSVNHNITNGSMSMKLGDLTINN